MSEPVRCPSCGASNAPGATWCGQCFTRFDSSGQAPAAVSAAPERSDAPEPGPEPHLQVVRSGPIERTKGRLQWHCPACDTENPIDASVCSVCGTPMAAIFGATTKKELKRVGPKAVAYSMLLPGLGHGWAGRIGDAIARGVLFCWTLGVGLLLITRKGSRAAGTFRGIGAVFVIAAIAVWMISFLEAQRLSKGDASGLVPGRALMWASAALTAVLFVGLGIAAQTR